MEKDGYENLFIIISVSENTTMDIVDISQELFSLITSVSEKITLIVDKYLNK